MLTVKTPEIYINKLDAIKEAGKYIKQVGTKPLIIGGETALGVVKDDLVSSLKAENISTEHIEYFKGFPSQNQFDKYAEIARNINADVIIGIGGGRVLDTSKAAADILGIPVVTIPTIAATCAAWAAISVQYDDEGAYVKIRPNKHSAKLIIADPKVIFTAPKRYLFSGVVDTFAKLYETRPSLERFPENITYSLAVKGSQLAFDNLEKQTLTALKEAENNVYGQAATDVIDAIVYLAGFAGSFQDDNLLHYSFAHPFYHTSTRLSNTRHKLHGEKVAYGIVTQLVLENRSTQEIKDAIKLFDKYEAAFTLGDLGINEDVEHDIEFLGEDVLNAFPYVPYTKAQIKDALLDADKITKQVKTA